MAVILPLRKQKPDKDYRAFLPAALEIVETPASPLGRAVAYAIVAFFVLAMSWACLGKVDIVASAKGKIIPSGRTKVIQPFETGVVRAIHVQDGQVVRAGEPLIELDPTINAAESKRYENDLIAAQLDVARLQAELQDGGASANFTPPANAPPESWSQSSTSFCSIKRASRRRKSPFSIDSGSRKRPNMRPPKR
jgi:membrane fusion protein, hemolysin D